MSAMEAAAQAAGETVPAVDEAAPQVEIRSLKTLKEFTECVDIERAVWGYDPEDLIPSRMFLLASRIGGQVLGAFVDGTPAGFAMALPGVRNGHPYLHSHMLGVLAEHRNLRIGQRLKLAQREEALARGFEVMEWTFDPLEIKNAHMNITRLGAVVRRYAPNFYGPSSSPLQGGLPTDRVYAEWWLRSERVERVLRGDAPAYQIVERVEVPSQIYAWKAQPEHRDEALAVQSRNATALQAAFARGLAVVGYDRRPDGDGEYLLGVWSDAPSNLADYSK
jgi:predicted GNAT superfamily acetyltransferase